MNKTSAEEKNMMQWKELVQAKFQASVESAIPNYLTTIQLVGLSPYETKLELTKAERQFIEDSREEQKKRGFLAKPGCQKQLAVGILLLLFLLLASMLTFYNTSITEGKVVQHKELINSIPFYKENFTISVRKDSGGHLKYGFINKVGILKIPYDYEEARHFDEYGFARVKVKGALFLIDTNNLRYPLAETVLALTEEVTALYLNEQGLEVIPQEVWQNLQLKVLVMKGNYLTKIPKEIGQLLHLKVLDLSSNYISLIENGIEQIPSLEQLNLYNNNLESLPETLTQKTTLVINFGGHSMQQQHQQGNYKNKKQPVVVDNYNAEVDVINKEINREEASIIEDEKARNDEVQGSSSMIGGLEKNTAATKTELLLEDLVILVARPNFDWRFKLLPFKGKCKLLVIHSAVSSRDLRALKKGFKMMFVAGFEKRTYDFAYDLSAIKINGRIAYINSCILERNQLEWMQKNTITQMRYMDMKRNEMHPYSIDSQRLKGWKKYVSDFLMQNQ
jgi:hypothetical protein